jgi:hypothetical protein
MLLFGAYSIHKSHSSFHPSPLLSVTYLLDRGADPNLPNSLGLTPLMLATLRLAALKADEATDTQAVVDTLVTMIRKLLEAGADPEVALPRWKARHPSSKGIIQVSPLWLHHSLRQLHGLLTAWVLQVCLPYIMINNGQGCTLV